MSKHESKYFHIYKETPRNIGYTFLNMIFSFLMVLSFIFFYHVTNDPYPFYVGSIPVMFMILTFSSLNILLYILIWRVKDD